MRAERVMIEDISMTILSIEGCQEINQHAKVKIKGYVDEKMAEKLMRKAEVDEKVTVTAIEQDKKQVFFEKKPFSPTFLPCLPDICASATNRRTVKRPFAPKFP